MTSPTLPIPLNLDKIKQFCQHYHIRKLSLFGSVLREDFTDQIKIIYGCDNVDKIA